MENYEKSISQNTQTAKQTSDQYKTLAAIKKKKKIKNIQDINILNNFHLNGCVFAFLEQGF